MLSHFQNGNQADREIEDKLESEIFYYLKDKYAKIGDPLVWWKANKGKYPTIAKVNVNYILENMLY